MKINYLQFAKDYDFENAWIINPENQVTTEQIQQYLQTGSYKGLCCEIFLETDKGYLIIGFSSLNDDFLNFIEESLILSKSDSKLEQYIKKAELDSPDLIRIGILDYWFKTGLRVIWEKGQDMDFSREKILQSLSTTPQLIRTTLKPQGISFYFAKSDSSTEHWLMYDISRKENDEYVLDVERVLELLEKRFHN